MTLRPARRLAVLLPWAAAALGGAIVAAVAVALLLELRAALHRTQAEVSALAESAAEAVSRRLEALEYGLSAIAGAVRPERLDDPEHREHLHRLARRTLAVSDGALVFSVFDAVGTLVATSRVPPERMEHVSFADSPAFLTVVRDWRPSLSVSERYTGRLGLAAGRPVIAVGLPVLDPNGAIGAVVSAILPAEGPGSLLPEFTVPEGVSVLLVLTDGTPIGRLPVWTERSSPVARIDAAPDDLVAARAVRGGTSAVVVLRSHGGVLRDWARLAVPVGAAALFFAVALVVLAQRLARTLAKLDRAAGELAAREAEMRRVADSLGIGLWVRRSPQSRTEYFGDFVERLTGKPRTLLESRPNIWRHEVVVPEDRDELKRSYRSADLTRGWQMTYRIFGADGTVRWVEDKAIQLPGPDGRPGPVYGAVTDITEIREARETIARQSRQLEDAKRLAGLCFWRLKPGGDRYEWDEQSYRQFGVDPATFVPTTAATWSLVEDADRPRLLATLARVAETGETESVVFRFRRVSDGALRVRWSLISAERDETGRVVYLNGVSQDITDREALHEALIRRDLQIAEAGRLAGLGFWRRPLDGSGRLEWSPEMFRHVGETPETFTPTLDALRDRVVPADRQALERLPERVLETGAPGQITYRVVDRQGRVRHLWVSMAVERDGDGQPIALYGVALDISDEIEAERRLARQEKQIAEVGRVAGIGFYSRALDGSRFETTAVFRRQHGFPEDYAPSFAEARSRVHPDDLSALQALTARLEAGEETASLTFRLVLPGGNVRRIRLHASLERDETGAAVAINGLTQDVTEEVEARERLERQQGFLEAARKAGRIGFYRRNLDTDLYEWTPDIYEDYGVDPTTFVPTRDKVFAFIHPDDRAEAEAARQRLMAIGESGTLRFRIIRPDGTVRWREAVAKLQRDETGRPVAVVGVTRDITEEVEARAQLVEQAERLRKVERVAKVGFYRRALDGSIMVASEEKLRQFGFPPDAGPLDIAAFRARFHPDDLPIMEEAGRRIVEEGVTETATVRVVRPDGTTRWIRIVAGLERDAAGRPLAVTGLSQDVTEEVEAEERLRRQERLLADAGRVARLGFWRRRLDEETMEWSDEVYRHWGFVPRSVTPTLGLIRSRLVAEDLSRWEETRAKLAASGETQMVECRVRHDDGTIRWLRITAGLERDREGRPTVYGTTQDVTEAVTANERIARAQLQLAEAARLAGLGFWRLPVGSDRFEVTDIIPEQLGRDPTSFTGSIETYRREIWLEEDAELLLATLEKVRQSGEPAFVTYRVRRPDGAIRVRSSTVALERAADGTPLALVGVSQDVTERIEQQQRLERSQRLSALGELTGGIAHDVNNLLSVIGLNLELVREQLREGEAQELATAALAAVEKGAKLTRGLLAFAQRQPLRPTAVPLAPLLGGLETLLRRALGGRVELRISLAPATPPALADAAQLESALVNLVLNARDAMPNGGTVSISAAVATEAELAALGVAAPAVRIAVADDGVGMTAEVLARAFEPFFTTKGSGKGTGLGLAMVYGFARQSGGEVRIDSAPGKGTTVTLWLPAAASPPERQDRGQADLAALAGATVLIVEDEPPLRAAIERLCAEAGLRTHAVGDGDAALALLRYGVTVDLVLTDVRMPGRLDGHALAAEIRALRPNLPILLMTGYDDTGLADTVVPILRKPFSRDDLLDALARLLREARTPAF
ncbi:PAS domain-containing protein [Elioraea thermophila]|uniref:PAS domain-containing protein n=1 Tax=Elioraea thermophila TaxID=2185104 RepID=UPI000DF1D5B1|nr:PAS domain-containing protein [Elioraea thermophila]